MAYHTGEILPVFLGSPGHAVQGAPRVGLFMAHDGQLLENSSIFGELFDPEHILRTKAIGIPLLWLSVLMSRHRDLDVPKYLSVPANKA